MILSIRAKNLGCFDDGEHIVNLAPLTIVVGPNNVGKSMMIAGFNMLRTLMFRGMAWSTESYNLGDFTSAVHNHDVSRNIELGTTVGKDSVLASTTTIIEGSSGYRGFSWHPQTVNIQEAQSFLRNCWYFRASRSEIPVSRQAGQQGVATPWEQDLDPSGSNIITYLLERWTDQDPKWTMAQDWLRKFDPELSILKSPLRANMASLVTTNRHSNVDVNLAYQGTGIQKALTAIAAVIFSPPGSTIFVEEPEVHLHKDSQTVLADLFNFAIETMGKQIVFSTHSWDMLLPYISDVARDMRKRGGDHVQIDRGKFIIQEFKRMEGRVSIEEYPLRDKIFKDAQTHFGHLLG